MDPLATFANQSIRNFARFYPSVLASILDSSPVPLSLLSPKLDLARPFVHCLLRKTTINHLAQAVTALLSNKKQVSEMIEDWEGVDLESFREQLSHLLPEIGIGNSFEGMTVWVKESIHAQLIAHSSLTQWALWLDSLVDQLTTPTNASASDPESLYRDILLKWLLFSNLFMRDLTLKSSLSFGAFHLLNLLFQEYIFHSIEHRLDEHRRWLTISSSSNNATNGNSFGSFESLFNSTQNVSAMSDDQLSSLFPNNPSNNK